ncbi:DNA polymerase delta subunit 4 [Entomortierella parvispora]|uniref:DNA polymerase delta subunit 4 n=1 Tax=Entomortierella parvispora TaxID=205924 RepID=A0A9P3HBN8_9FUNG|nr:DNA polymerase delta subunit 4 [Entomortierella parvispora]
MPPKKSVAASPATGAVNVSAADFFKPAKPSTSIRATPLKNPYQKSPLAIVQIDVDRRPLSNLSTTLPISRKHPAPDTACEDDGFGEDLDLNEVLSDEDNFFGLKNRFVKNKSSSFKDFGSSTKIDLKPSAHQEDLNELLLRQFDLTSKYGPCLGLTRLERWERAALLDLNPPNEIKDLLGKTKNRYTPLFASQI